MNKTILTEFVKGERYTKRHLGREYEFDNFKVFKNDATVFFKKIIGLHYTKI